MALALVEIVPYLLDMRDSCGDKWGGCVMSKTTGKYVDPLCPPLRSLMCGSEGKKGKPSR